MLLKIVYMLTCRVLGLAVLLCRGDRAKDAELLVLRHENAVLRRPFLQAGILQCSARARTSITPRVSGMSALMSSASAGSISVPPS
jgi:hypothetical protein